jgi:hypothetical protein
MFIQKTVVVKTIERKKFIVTTWKFLGIPLVVINEEAKTVLTA